jgi:hypothetical protein
MTVVTFPDGAMASFRAVEPDGGVRRSPGGLPHECTQFADTGTEALTFSQEMFSVPRASLALSI